MKNQLLHSETTFEKRKHFIAISMSMFLLSTSINLFQTFIFNEVSKIDGITLRYNIGLQIFSFLNFCGSFFWTYLADKTHRHLTISFVSCIFYGILAFLLFFASSIESITLKMIYLVIITICREFTLGGFLPIMFAVILNYCNRNGYDHSLLGLANIWFNFGTAHAMLINFIISRHEYLQEGRKGLFLSFAFCLGTMGFLFYKFVPKFQTEETNQTEEDDSGNIVDTLKLPSMWLLYCVVLVSGIFKCVNGNFTVTFYEMRIADTSFVKILLLCRYLTEGITLLVLSYTSISYFIPFTSSLLLAGCGLLVDLRSESLLGFILSDILKGMSRSSFAFSSVLIFKMYSTPKTATQVQGMKNSGYNGLSCVILGILGLLLIPGDVKDYRTLKGQESVIMKERLKSIFTIMFKTNMFALFLTVFIALVSRYFLLKNR